MSDEDCYRRLNPCKAAREVARLAITAFGDWVGVRSTLGWSKTRFSIARLGVSVDITRLQVPPRPPKKSIEIVRFRCFFLLLWPVFEPEKLEFSGDRFGFPFSFPFRFLLSFPLRCYILNKAFHSGSTLLLHLIRYMAIYIQGESCGGMTKMFLHGFDRVTRFDGYHGVRVP